ncbi:ZIP family metal transporter [Lentisalinibacter orientalis]|uniref:ZIP family metal transporter n=1 Tax=Lentisalinibacter orientalis TaxID=2992241 RepID=UPI00386730F6
MSAFYWILGSGILMSLIALVGSLTLVLREETLQRLLLPLVALAAGSLIGGAFFHMLPAGLAQADSVEIVFVAAIAGFTSFFLLEQLLHWHHCHRAGSECREPVTYLILIGDGLHNFIGGLAVASTFLVDIRLGITAWIAAALHEVPQELGDFGVLVHGGWPRRRALLMNLLSGLAFLAGGLVTWFASFRMDVSLLVPFAAGNFLYIGAADLIPEVNRHAVTRSNLVHVAAFLAGIALLWTASLIK